MDKLAIASGVDGRYSLTCLGCTWHLSLSQVFPLDYILITVITVYFVVTSMAGIRNMGIWFFWIRVNMALLQFYLKNRSHKYTVTWIIFFFSYFQLYKIRPKRTRPQALLFLCMILLLIVLHSSYMIYSLAPQYVMYGSQKYIVQVRKNTLHALLSIYFCRWKLAPSMVVVGGFKTPQSSWVLAAGWSPLAGSIAFTLVSCLDSVSLLEHEVCTQCICYFDSLPSTWSEVVLLCLTVV